MASSECHFRDRRLNSSLFCVISLIHEDALLWLGWGRCYQTLLTLDVEGKAPEFTLPLRLS